ncbi:hypothetical protein E3N88_31034 [Mikania micrantha]|uniref:Uncharacterized protein n=1 Tax=Mikania micrantha TaxID=192012 RepID=A0A5N6MNI0_9ASTR|nr:hypothetical protein E3N88_31034 [Mikania micrantha]
MDLEPSVRVRRWGSGGIGKCGKRENIFNKVHVSRCVNFFGDGIKEVVSTLGGGIAHKDARGGAGLEFVLGVWSEPWICKATEATKFVIVGKGVKKAEEGGIILEGWCWQAVERTRGSSGSNDIEALASHSLEQDVVGVCKDKALRSLVMWWEAPLSNNQVWFEDGGGVEEAEAALACGLGLG